MTYKILDNELLDIHKEYTNKTISMKFLHEKYKITPAVLLVRFKKQNLWIRPPGFRSHNSRGKYNQDNVKLRYLWFYNFAYKRRARRKKLEFSLTEEQFIELVVTNCFYCNKDWKTETRLVNKKRIMMGTIDRKDSSKGYNLQNCVPCCKLCNTIKMDMTYNQFILKIVSIVKHLQLL